MKTPAYVEHYAMTGSGLNACMASGQLAWMKRHQPERIARATTAFHCKDWLYFNLTGERATDPAEANFTFGNFRTRRYEPSILEAMGIADCERLLPPIVDGASVSHPLGPAASAATGLPAGLPVVLCYLDVVCTALGGGLYEPDRDVGVSVFGSTGMHMRFAASPDAVRLNESRSGYVMLFPIPLASATMQSNMAATLNIDWLLDIAREAASWAGAETNRAALLKGMDARVLDATPGSAIYHPYIFEAGERGPFLDPNARAQFSGLSTRTSLAGLMRAVFEGLAFAARDCYSASGAPPREVRLGGGAARSAALRSILASALGASVRTVKREETGAAGAAMTAAVCLGDLRRHGAMRERVGDALAGRYDRARPDDERTLCQALPDLPGYPRENAASLGGSRRSQTGERREGGNCHNRRSFHAALDVRDGDTRQMRGRSDDPHP